MFERMEKNNREALYNVCACDGINKCYNYSFIDRKLCGDEGTEKPNKAYKNLNMAQGRAEREVNMDEGDTISQVLL